MSDLCERVRSVLELYAEGELHHPATVELVRAHLLGCDDCRRALELYDALTRSLLAGELEGERSEWTVLEHERRVEGILKRLSRAVPTRPPTYGIPSGLRESVEPSEGPLASRLDWSPDDAGNEWTTATGEQSQPRTALRTPSGIQRTAGAKRGLLVAAATLLGVLTLWLAYTPEGSGSREISRDTPAVLSPDATSSHEERYDPVRSARDRQLRWVVGGEGTHPRFQAAPSKPVRSPTGRTVLYGVDYRYDPRARWYGSSKNGAAPADFAPPPNEAEIEWVVEIILTGSPLDVPGEGSTEPRYLLVPEHSPVDVPALSDVARSSPPPAARSRWFRPARAERLPPDGSASRFRVGNSTIYRVCVYEETPRFDLPCPNWRSVRWDTTFSQGPLRRDHHRTVTPGSFPTLLGNWSASDYSAAGRRF